MAAPKGTPDKTNRQLEEMIYKLEEEMTTKDELIADERRVRTKEMGNLSAMIGNFRKDDPSLVEMRKAVTVMFTAVPSLFKLMEKMAEHNMAMTKMRCESNELANKAGIIREIVEISKDKDNLSARDIIGLIEKL